MNRHVNAIAGRFSLQKPQREFSSHCFALTTGARHRRRVGVIKLFGPIKFEPGFDYQVERTGQ